jgi:hypothetical protein
MAIWLRFDKSRLEKVTLEEFLKYVKKHYNLLSMSSTESTAQELS